MVWMREHFCPRRFLSLLKNLMIYALGSITLKMISAQSTRDNFLLLTLAVLEYFSECKIKKTLEIKTTNLVSNRYCSGSKSFSGKLANITYTMKMRCKIIEYPVKPGNENFQIFENLKYRDENGQFWDRNPKIHKSLYTWRKTPKNFWGSLASKILNHAINLTLMSSIFEKLKEVFMSQRIHW